MPVMGNVNVPAFRETVASPEPVGVGAGSTGYGGSNQVGFPPSTPMSSSTFSSESSVPDFGDEPLPLEQIEKQHILSTLETTKGNRTHAAKILGISIRTLRNKLAIYREDGEFIAGEE